MNTSRILVACGVVCLAVVAVLVVGARAYSLSPYKWAVSPVVFYLNPANADVSAAAAEAAISPRWPLGALSRGAAFGISTGGRVNDTSTSNDGRNVVIFRNASSGAPLHELFVVVWWSRVDSDVIF